jgi:DNA-binding transcriptional LysR family regulator
MKPQFPNIRHLRAFAEVAKRGSISRAAEHVYLSQPAITHAISKLETGLDTALFTRLHKGMALTEAGET